MLIHSRYTPGPWIVGQDQCTIWKDDRIIAAITLKRPQTVADAILIHAAPELFEGLCGLLALLTERGAGHDWRIDRARTAVARAIRWQP